MDHDQFQFHRGPFGAFRILDGNVRAMTHRAAMRRRDEAMTIAEFEREIARYLSM